MEAEYVTLSMAMRDPLPYWFNLFLQVEIKMDQQFYICCNVFEDNAGSLALAKVELLGWHHDQNIMPSNITGFGLVWNQRIFKSWKLNKKQQLVDIFAKGLVKSTFEHIRELLMG